MSDDINGVGRVLKNRRVNKLTEDSPFLIQYSATVEAIGDRVFVTLLQSCHTSVDTSSSEIESGGGKLQYVRFVLAKSGDDGERRIAHHAKQI